MIASVIQYRVANNLEEFSRLSSDCQREVTYTLQALCRIANHPGGVVAGAAEESSTHAGVRGMSKPQLLRKYYAFKACQDWRVLVNHSKNKPATGNLPSAFIDYWCALVMENQRASKPAYRKLVASYLSGKPVPGYPICHNPHADLPHGWTYPNLWRYRPTKFETKAARQGRSAAADYRPQVFTTRVGLKVGQYYVFDDLEHDLKVTLPGVNKVALRPLELSCLDLYSGCKVRWGLKPTLENDDGSKQKLKEREMRFLLANILFTIGYRPDGTVLMAEHGTAAIRDDLERILHDCTDGAITVQRSGIEGAAAFSGAYCGRPKGNFRFKAALESHHNLVHNELADLPGQMGRNRDNAPEQMHGRDRATVQLLKALEGLPAEAAAQLRLPYLPFQQFAQILDLVYARINGRMEHDLEGWDEAGLTLNEFRLMTGGDWMPMSRMLQCSEDERMAIAAVINRPGMVRQRRMSPTEVWDSGRSDLVRIQPYAVPLILGNDFATERRLGDDHLFTFEDRTLGPGQYRFEGIVQTTGQRSEQLRPGEHYMVTVNPFDTTCAFVCSPDGGYLGLAKQWGRVSRVDTESLHRQMGRAAHIEKELLKPVAERGAEITQRRIEDSRNNARVLRSFGVTERLPGEGEDMPAVSASDMQAATRGAREEQPEEFSAQEISDLLRNP